MTRHVTVERLIEKVEGEATLKFHKSEEKIAFVDILFTSERGIERILKGKYAQDALVINPRVCGICGHAHLIATVKALEACYADITISPKAESIRELTLNMELIQNHFKWFYLTLLPLFETEQKVLHAAEASRMMSQAIAHLSGQYPHNSYAIVGGVVCDPTQIDLLQVKNLLCDTIAFFESHVVIADSSELIACEKVEKLFSHRGDLPRLLHLLKEREWHAVGRSFDRFIVFGENSYFKRGKSVKTRIQPNIDEKYLQLAPNSDSLAKNVTYKGKYYEVGPLSRAMLLKTPLIKDAHRRYGDSLLTRIVARTCEIVQLLHHSLKLVDKIDPNDSSWIEPPQPILSLTGEGTGFVEAARGSLIHGVRLREGVIENYRIVTPTQWNLSQGTVQDPGIAQQAMMGLESESLAEIVFKSFDVCSVCTTH